jgi:hypothetical protein
MFDAASNVTRFWATWTGHFSKVRDKQLKAEGITADIRDFSQNRQIPFNSRQRWRNRGSLLAELMIHSYPKASTSSSEKSSIVKPLKSNKRAGGLRLGSQKPSTPRTRLQLWEAHLHRLAGQKTELLARLDRKQRPVCQASFLRHNHSRPIGSISRDAFMVTLSERPRIT